MAEDRPRVLVVDNDPIVAESLAEFLSEEGYSASTACGGEEALRAIASGAESGSRFQVVLSDVSMPGMDGMELLRKVRERHPALAFVVMTGYGAIESAVEALRAGASDYLTKPIVDAELRVAMERAMREQALRVENSTLRRRLDKHEGFENIVGADCRMRKVFELVEAVAPSRTTVLMTGESGTGKSLIAREIHRRSPRSKKPFVELACGSIPETLLESELFGHVKGAFTGAHADKQGRFQAADGGTLFLDEINSASPGMQLKLLRVLQERKFEPVGSSESIEVDVRVVLASNQALEDLVADGRFRQDLYYRINVVKIDLPPLRERVGDIPLLAERMLAEFSGELNKQLVGFSAEAMDALRRYPFPGNVRELRNAVERAAVLSRSPTIQLGDLPQTISGGDSPLADRIAEAEEGSWSPMPLAEALREPERKILLKALEANDWNRQQTADDLEINRTTLYKKMKQLNIEPPPDRRAG